ncbi:12104_t:CDS:2 [Ambispora leptoticha]|uniref:12104_t:CDS:1 n=1 Tax=Ambispora leptoticha TaxID=144679 RepID=A0A9N9GCQ3_9GLOM|nr:12104_t:CDS:2 [Ambispora leptoticha]
MNSTSTAPRYCDWRIEIYNCENSAFWTIEVYFSLVSFTLLAFSGTFIFFYRYRYMWQGLFVDHAGIGIRPLPVDCLLLFFTIAGYLRAIHCLCLILDVYTAYWQREFVQEIAWTFLSYGAVTYLVGIIYTIPVSYTNGTAGIVSLGNGVAGDKKGSFNLTSHKLYIPTPKQLNIYMAIWCLWPSLIALPCAVFSGIEKDRNNYDIASRYTAAQYVADFIFDMSFAFIAAYYGLNFMVVLKGTIKSFEGSNATRIFSSSNGNNPTRKAFHRLKYTMAYLSGLALFSGPWWLVWGLAHQQLISSINNISIFLSISWYIAGAQPMIAVCQYVLAKRIYQKATGQTSTNSSNGSMAPMLSNITNPRSPITPKRASFQPAIIKIDNTVDIEMSLVGDNPLAQEATREITIAGSLSGSNKRMTTIFDESGKLCPTMEDNNSGQ